MPGFETIVRTSQSLDVSPPRPAPTAPPSSNAPATVVLSLGANGSGKTMNGSSNFNRTTYQDKKPKEKLDQNGRVINLGNPFPTP